MSGSPALGSCGGCESACLRGCSVPMLRSIRIKVCENHDVRELQCMGVLMYGQPGSWVLKYVGIAVRRLCCVWVSQRLAVWAGQCVA